MTLLTANCSGFYGDRLLDSVKASPEAPDRVRISGVRGQPPPRRLKVCVNELGGFRNPVEFMLTGLDIDAKAEWVRSRLVDIPEELLA